MPRAKKNVEDAKSLVELERELEAILMQLEQDELDLETSFVLYQKGMQLLKQCNAAVDTVEKQLIILEEGSFGMEE